MIVLENLRISSNAYLHFGEVSGNLFWIASTSQFICPISPSTLPPDLHARQSSVDLVESFGGGVFSNLSDIGG